jgi:hypothetical protein
VRREDVAKTYRGYDGTLSVEEDVLALTHEGAVAKLGGLTTNVSRRMPLASISDVGLHASSMLTNGWLAVGVNGQLAPDLKLSTASASRDAILFRRKDQAMFESLHQWMLEVIAHNRRRVAPVGQERAAGLDSSHPRDGSCRGAEPEELLSSVSRRSTRRAPGRSLGCPTRVHGNRRGELLRANRNCSASPPAGRPKETSPFPAPDAHSFGAEPD